ncbi:unnamed protein product [Didymodactylos carnosus]|uniref:Peptidase M13 N-terminal domain-containing protein n=1 Tax=Didymodactylos carnosus TaxID=1234261 RepID=A0A8S2FR27_9BILA|nr:unnamed protein product [Didymodactylos carnosus]CAF4328942.1 unnamed protein product [Didymodactylos carnosus]
MDIERINNLGYLPIQNILNKIDTISNYTGLIHFLIDMYKNYNMGYLFNFYVGPDDKNSHVNIANFQQIGIDLPERDYYFRNDPVSKNIREKYLVYIKQILKLINLTGNVLNISQIADDILTLETQIAVSHRTPNDLRNPIKNYNRFHLDDLNKLMPNLDWSSILKRMMINTSTILIGQPDYYQLLDRLIVNQPLDLWKNKIRFSIVNSFACYLSKEFIDAQFNFYKRIIDGQKQQQERWKIIVAYIDKSKLKKLFLKYLNLLEVHFA